MQKSLLQPGMGSGLVRLLSPSDLDAFQAYRAIPELGRFQGWKPMSRDDATRFLDEMGNATRFIPATWVQLGIADPHTNQLIGDIGLYLSADGSSGEVGYTLAPAAQGQGIATRAVREALQHFFSATTATRVFGITDVRNLPSIRLLERLGFRLVETRSTMAGNETCLEEVYVLEVPEK